MKIASADLVMQAGHSLQTQLQRDETLRTWRGARPDFEGLQSASTRISDTGRNLLASMTAALPAPAFPPAPPPAATQSSEAQAIQSASETVDNDPVLAMIKQMIESLIGHEIRVFDMQAFSTSISHVEVQSNATSQSLQAAQSGRAGWGMEYDYHAVTEEHEQTSFSASGTIRTADGQEISFTLDLAMTRYHREETNVSLRAGDAIRKDPLVVNFGGTAVQLAQHAGQSFSFDLNGDGTAELLPLFASGSGYLALDLNGNGKIDSGKELFGPQSGNGFADLAKLDADQNGWIDANDAAFNKLLVWTPAAEGSGDLRKLGDLGIGALGLQQLATPFSLRAQDNSDLGAVKSSGVYLSEDGKAGSLQEIDLTV